MDEVDVAGQDPKVPSSVLSGLQQGKHEAISLRAIRMAMVRRPPYGKPYRVFREQLLSPAEIRNRPPVRGVLGADPLRSAQLCGGARSPCRAHAIRRGDC